ncbi:hypothetical protein T4A_10343 [Trichinella pseudospiralis]|uniref:Uncharacterized protein n=1 Tax=Trichinella pseudospiralis TaxID=6337 RepID=A0A0V1DXP8_TRIPS|nr:hypothetical protein T4A_10343 [Trichinella pseudospiralis]
MHVHQLGACSLVRITSAASRSAYPTFVVAIRAFQGVALCTQTFVGSFERRRSGIQSGSAFAYANIRWSASSPLCPRQSLCDAHQTPESSTSGIDGVFACGLTEGVHHKGSWSDSSVALSWIKGDPRKLKTFAANRVQERIRQTKPSQWRCVSAVDNPADRLSRGCTLERLLKDHLWWNGADWLLQPESEWPRLSVLLSEEVRGTDPERRMIIVLTTTLPARGIQMVIDPTRYSRMAELLRVTECCLREDREWSKSSQMTLLFSFVDMLLRVGGRLTNAAWGHKRPLLLLPTERLWLSSCDEPPSQSCTRV